jgi:hypothetical protein
MIFPMDILSDPPCEAPIERVATGDFRGLSRPILVACRDRATLAAFCVVHRLKAGDVLSAVDMGLQMDRSKPLILLPGWDEDPRTAEVVSQWDHHDRYTVTLDEHYDDLTEDWSAAVFFLLSSAAALACALLSAVTCWQDGKIGFAGVTATLGWTVAAVALWPRRWNGGEA